MIALGAVGMTGSLFLSWGTVGADDAMYSLFALASLGAPIVLSSARRAGTALRRYSPLLDMLIVLVCVAALVAILLAFNQFRLPSLSVGLLVSGASLAMCVSGVLLALRTLAGSETPKSARQ